MEKFKEIQERLIAQMQSDIKIFLSQHQGVNFYCFAFDCNTEYAQILLCLNTETYFQQSLARYQSGSSKQHYKSSEDIFSLKYNTGDWAYQGFADYTVMNEDELVELYGDNYELLSSEMMRFNYSLLEQLCSTQVFKNIPKTESFSVICIDHDEDPDVAMENTNNFVQWGK